MEDTQKKTQVGALLLPDVYLIGTKNRTVRYSTRAENVPDSANQRRVDGSAGLGRLR